MSVSKIRGIIEALFCFVENRNKLLDWAGVASELGFLIAIPIVVFALVGRWLDRRFGTGVVFLILGILVAITATSLLIARRLQSMVKRLEK